MPSPDGSGGTTSVRSPSSPDSGCARRKSKAPPRVVITCANLARATGKIIENSNSDASVPQALALMNGELMPQILHRYSQLMLTVGRAHSADEKIDAAYMAVLSRKPTAREKALCL